MEVDAMLCDHAEAADGKLFINGGGIAAAWVQPQPPYLVTLALGVVIHVPYTETNNPHNLSVQLNDEDGHPVVPWTNEQAVPGSTSPIQAIVPFNVGRPAQLPMGDTQPVALGMNFVGLPMPSLGLFTFILEVDGKEARRLPFRVNALPPQMMQVIPQAG
jgi:hypothetical protein